MRKLFGLPALLLALLAAGLTVTAPSKQATSNNRLVPKIVNGYVTQSAVAASKGVTNLTPSQVIFCGTIAKATGMDTGVMCAWVFSEMSNSAAVQRDQTHNYDCLNIGYTNTTWLPGIHFASTLKSPQDGAQQSADWLAGKANAAGYGIAHPGIQAILQSADKAPYWQIMAIANSPWATSHYGNPGHPGTWLLKDLEEIRSDDTIAMANAAAGTIEDVPATASGGRIAPAAKPKATPPKVTAPEAPSAPAAPAEPSTPPPPAQVTTLPDPGPSLPVDIPNTVTIGGPPTDTPGDTAPSAGKQTTQFIMGVATIESNHKSYANLAWIACAAACIGFVYFGFLRRNEGTVV